MNRRLREDDRRAVDLLLDNASHAGNGNGNGLAAGSAFVIRDNSNIEARLRGVERVLRLLDQMPAVEPPGDLAQRTLARIEESQVAREPGAIPAPPARLQSPFLDGRPHA